MYDSLILFLCDCTILPFGNILGIEEEGEVAQKIILKLLDLPLSL